MSSFTRCHFFQCSTCPEQFMYKKNLTFHMMKIHGYPKPHAVSFLYIYTVYIYRYAQYFNKN